MNAIEWSEIVRNIGLLGVALAGLIVAIWRARSADRQANVALRQNALAEASRVDGLFHDAIETLASDSPVRRLGGIYTLIALSRDHDDLRQPVISVFQAFLRELGNDASVVDRMDYREVIAYLSSAMEEV